MSYARWNEEFFELGKRRKSDVYVINGDTCFCKGGPEEVESDPIPSGFPAAYVGMIAHLMAHLSAGHAVPPRALDRLWIELLESGVTVECIRCEKTLPPRATAYAVDTKFLRDPPGNAPDRTYLCARCYVKHIESLKATP